MDTASIWENLKVLTLDYVSGRKKAHEIVSELHGSIESALIYEMDEKEPQREFITQVYVSLDNLLHPDFPPSAKEMQYFAECFEGKREFKLAEVREFVIISKADEIPTKKVRRPKTRIHSKSKQITGRLHPKPE